MQQKHRKKIKYLLLITIVLLAVLGVLSLVISSKLKPFVQRELGKIVEEATTGLYRVRFQKVSINPFTANAWISELYIEPDTLVYAKLVKEQKAPNNLYNIYLDNLSIKNFHLWKAYFYKKIVVNQLQFKNPKISMTNKVLAFNENKPARPDKSPYEYLKNFFSSLQVKEIRFDNSSFRFIDRNGEKPQIDTVSNINIILKDWLIDAHSAQDSTRFFLLKDANISINDYSYATPDSMYYIKAKQFDFTWSKKMIGIQAFALEPRYSEKDFARLNGYARDRYSLVLNNLNIKGVDLLTYIKNRNLLADEVLIADGRLGVFNDRSYPKKELDRTGRFPHQLMQHIGLPFHIKTIFVQKMDISYAEFNPQSGERGHISFQRTSGKINNLSNRPSDKQKNPLINVQIESYLMGQGRLNIGFVFDMNSPKAAFRYKGHLGEMDGNQLNYITRPLAMVQIKNAAIKSLDFEISADQQEAKGKVKLLYTDLSLGLMRKHPSKDKLERLGVLSLLARSMIINESNPTENGQLIVAPVHFKRVPTASFFSFLWRSLYQGVRYSLGFTPQKEKEVQAYIKRFEDLKNNRDKRRLKREIQNRLKPKP